MQTLPQKILGYYRVSTNQQGVSGLGLEAQRSAVADFARREGAEIVAHYTEVESGRHDDRPELAKALAHCRFVGARLVIAKLDRLARRVSFVASLMDSGVDFVACDNPHANRLTVHILAAVAEDEAKRISQRTKDALAAYKARGGALGGRRPGCRPLSPEARRKGQEAGGAAVAKRAAEANAHVRPVVEQLAATGLNYSQIARELNARSITTRRGKSWTHVQVRGLLAR